MKKINTKIQQALKKHKKLLWVLFKLSIYIFKLIELILKIFEDPS